MLVFDNGLPDFYLLFLAGSIMNGGRGRRDVFMKQSQITDWCHEMIRSQAPKNGFYVDATMGNGNDTAFLCSIAWHKGKVLAFDIQKCALEATQKLLEEKGYAGRAALIHDGHENLDQYVAEASVDVICFNFGYLPGGDHRIATSPRTSLTAVSKGLAALKSGGMMSLCIYSGGDSGFEEKECLLAYLKGLSPREYTVIENIYLNRGNHPPIPVFLFKK